MGAWEWVVLALAVGVGLQLLALRYALRTRPVDEEGRHAPGGPVDGTPVERADAGDRRGGSPDGRRCSHCGERNDPGYTYCRRCVRLLGG